MTGPVFTPGLADVNLTLRVQVTATSKEDKDTAVATSELTAPVDGANLGNADNLTCGRTSPSGSSGAPPQA